MNITIGDDVFEMNREMVEVTSLHRPDTNWRFIDANGHEHHWHIAGYGGQPGVYSPERRYDVPTLVWVKDGEEYWEGDDEPHEVWHLECRLCGEHIQPGYTVDTQRQYVPGLTYYYINGQSVSEEEFRRRLELARG